MTAGQVIHQIEAKRFVITEAGQEAELTYELAAAERVNFLHTFVPFRLRGKGFAEQLVETGLSWARAEGLAIETRCWYVEKFLEPAG